MSTPTSNENNTTESAAPLETPVFTLENPAPAPEPENMEPSANPIPEHQAKYASTSIRNIKRLKDAKLFIQPVDPIALNIPQYFHYVKRPMSISVIEQKLQKGVYSDVEQFFDDFKLMVDNAIKFNGEKSIMASLANSLMQIFTKHMHNMPPREVIKPVKKTEPKVTTSLPSSQADASNDDTSMVSSIGSRTRRQIHPPKPKDIYTGESPKSKPKPKDKNILQDLAFAKQVIKDLISKKYQDINFPFLEPVDYVGLNIPHYLDYVKTPMDLGTIQKKLMNWEYANFDEFYDDVMLVFNNCYAFNPKGTDVHIMGKSLENIFKELMKNKPEHEVSEEEDPEEVSDDEESDTEDLEKELIKAGKSNPAIVMLEQQIATFQEQLRAMREIEYKNLIKNKKGAKNLLKKSGILKKKPGRKPKNADTPVTRKRRKSSAAGGATQKRKTSVSQEPVVQASYEMKKYMSEKLEQFSMDDMNAFSAFISANIPETQMPKDENGESYLDLSQLQGQYVILLFNTFFQKFGDFYESPQAPQPQNDPIFNTPSSVSSPFVNPSPSSGQRKVNQEGGKLEQIKQKLQSMNTKPSPGTSLPNSSQNFSASPNMKPRGLYLNNDNDDDSSDDESESEED